MSSIKDKQNKDRQAFPTENVGVHINNQGLTKREYFAGLAMQGLISRVPQGHLSNSKEDAKLALQYADALLNELSK